MIFCSSLHNIMQRADVCVKPHPDVLNIEDDHIEICELFRGGFSICPIERHKGQPCFFIDTIGYMLAIRGHPSEPMFRCKDLSDCYTQLLQSIGEMCCADQRSVIDNQRNIL